MRFLFSSLFLIIVFAVGAAAQTSCGAEQRSAPTILNLRLGMTTEEARSVFGKALKIKNKRSGEYTFFQNYIKDSPPASLAGVRAIYLRFFGGRLYQIEVFYDEKNDSRTLENFTGDLSRKFDFPQALWKIEYGQAEIDCGAFSLIADDVLNPRIQITDNFIRDKVEASRRKE